MACSRLDVDSMWVYSIVSEHARVFEVKNLGPLCQSNTIDSVFDMNG